MFWTVAIQAALNSRRTGGGGVRFCAEFTGAWPHAVSKLPSTKSERTSTPNRVLGIGHNVNQVGVKRLLVISVAVVTRHIYSVYEFPWQDMDLTDPKQPVLRIAERDLHRAK